MRTEATPPAAMPAPLRPVFERILAAATTDDRVVGVVVNGSVGAGTADRYSDLDVVIAYDDEADVDLTAAARELVGGAGPLLAAFTGEHVGEPSLVIGLVAEPDVGVLHLDVKCARVGDQAHRVEDGWIAWQRGDAVHRARAATQAAWPAPDPQWLEDRFWVWIHYGAAKVGRGELLECIDVLAFLRSAVLGPLIAVGRSRNASGVRRLETIAPDWLPQLHRTVAAPQPGACLDALLAAADLFVQVRPASVQAHPEAELAVRRYASSLRADVAG